MDLYFRNICKIAVSVRLVFCIGRFLDVGDAGEALQEAIDECDQVSYRMEFVLVWFLEFWCGKFFIGD